MKRSFVSLVVATLLFASAAARAATPNGIFTDHMVLQRDMPIAVWGGGKPGEAIEVRLAGHRGATTANEQGQWSATLDPLPAGGPHRLVIEGNYRVVIRDVLVGEVWLASGQSNMQWSLDRADEPDKAIAESANEQLRLFTVPRRATDEPQSDVDGLWQVSGPESTPSFSAVGYYFGRALQHKLGVPVGVISTNYGGTPAEAWTSREGLDAHDSLRYYLEQARDPKNSSRPYGLYNAMIHPLAPLSVRGAIWYQGESNAGKAYEYRTLFPAMIADWRRVFRQPEMPFFFVQLAPFKDKVTEPVDSDWAELREAQLKTALELPHTAMAVITDVGDEKDIHPKWKQPVGERLALAARAIVYGEKVEYSGPTVAEVTAKDGAVELRFDHATGGLKMKGNALTGFTIAGADGKFHNAEAEINGEDSVRIHCAEVNTPLYVRYGWANYPLGNLWNGADLPASPFRTDELPGVTQPK